MSDHPKHAQKRVQTMKRARAGEPELKSIAENERQRQRRAHDRNRAKLDEIKALPCFDCGRTFPPEWISITGPGSRSRSTSG